MAASWWDEIHWILWRIADRSDLIPVIQSARQVARDVVAPLLTTGVRSSCEWTPEKARILAAMDASGLNSIISSAAHGVAMPLALAAWELAWVDGGAATCSLSGSLAQMPIREFGTEEQRERYLDKADRRHGALCLTEPIPGAGTDALFLTGRLQVADWLPGGEPVLEIQKRGRFISHMDFADFVVAAVQGCGDRARGSCLVVLEPEDAGEFDRGPSVRKLGHQLSSTTNPVFGLRVPTSRILGGYTMDNGVVVPNLDHRRALEPALRRTRVILSLMTASKLLSVVEPLVHLRPSCRPTDKLDVWHRMVDAWAIGEAAASLGFSAARLSDDLDTAEIRSGARTSEAAVLCPAAKLFSTSQVTVMLQMIGALGNSCPIESDSGCLHDKLADAQLEALYMGPEALQRRLVSTAMIDGEFLKQFRMWTEEMDLLAQSHPLTGIRCLIAGMRLWNWTLDQLQQQTDSRGARLFCDARQGVTFPMADCLCWLLASRSLALDVLQLGKSGCKGYASASVSSFLSDLATIVSVRAAGLVGQTSASLLLGYDGRFPVSAITRNEFEGLRTSLDASLCGTMAARDRAASFIRAGNSS
jgi:alkylation response protein AidB-like acyl-CoA dehydrogenase